ncbi:MAG: hypothetical protein HZB65_00960 [Candidatus Aenigmarchaeota archaeon]|nr:hypothetical protein [Candidatus Aenigmarchaeota archaeon]
MQLHEIDSSEMPVCLGSALRVPDYSFENWGIPSGSHREESDRQYEIEWKAGSSKQMTYVVEAITGSGLGNYSQMLRDANADIVANIVKQSQERLNYIEFGAGVSTVNVFQRLADENVPKELWPFATLVEPSIRRLVGNSEDSAEKDPNAVAQRLYNELGMEEGKDFVLYVAKDTDIHGIVNPNSQDIASYVAVLHHHAYIDTPLKAVYNVLSPGGILNIADWHNAMWEHPNRVYEFLRDEFDWSTKTQDLLKFVLAYPKASEPAPELSELDAASNRNIKKFWKSWASVRKREQEAGVFRPEDDIWMLEAHRPVARQNEVLTATGYVLDSQLIKDLQAENPRRLVKDAGILYVTIAQKPF